MDKRESIEERVEHALIEGRWGLFDHLPSERGLAEEFGVNRATLRAALRALAARDIFPISKSASWSKGGSGPGLCWRTWCSPCSFCSSIS